MAGVSSDTRSVNRSTQRRPTPLCARERSGQRGKQRHIPDWIDRRPEGRKILADLNQKREMISCRTNSQLSTIDSQPSAALHKRRIKREAKLAL